MCKIYETRRHKNTVFIDFEDDYEGGVKKLSADSYEFGMKIGNIDFVVLAAKDTGDRDIDNSYDAVPFIDPRIKYEKPYWI